MAIQIGLPLAALMFAAASLLPGMCAAQESYPARTVRFIIPFPAATPPLPRRSRCGSNLSLSA